MRSRIVRLRILAVISLVMVALLPTSSMAQACTCRGMTWVWHRHIGDVDHVGADGITNAYQGDTPCSVALPILCLRKEGLSVPPYITPDFYNGWTGGHIQLTPPHLGSDLSSLAAANAICAQHFGPGYQIAEHHDGNGGWHWYAYGTILTSPGRFWVSINDQPANPWDSCPVPQGRIQGFVRDRNGTPIPGAQVGIGNGQFAVTTASGFYELLGVPLGTYTVRATLAGWTFGSVGFQNANYTVSLTSAGNIGTVSITGWNFDPVVFVHGWNSNSSAFGGVPAALKNKGYYTIAGQLETSMLWTPPLGENAMLVKGWIDQAKYDTGRDKVILYGHSMGGLVARAYLESGMYQGDVSRIFTYGSPHLGTPYLFAPGCLVQPSADAICQMTPPGMALFNVTHPKRPGVAYHLVAGNAPMWTTKNVCVKILWWKTCFNIPWPDMSFRNGKGWALGALIVGPDDALVHTCSASGMPGSLIDRYITREVHSWGLGPREYFEWNGGPSKEGFDQCTRSLLIDIDPSKVACGVLSSGPPPSCVVPRLEGAGALGSLTATPELDQLSRIEQGSLHAGASTVRLVSIEGGATAFTASWSGGSVEFTLIDPTGKVIDPAYAASIQGDPNDPENVEVGEPHPDVVIYTGDATQAAYYFPAARPGTWQLVLKGGGDIPVVGASFTTAAAFDSSLVAGFSVDGLSYAPGSTAMLRVTLSEPIQAADAQVMVLRSGGATQAMALTRVSATEYVASYAVAGPSGYVALDWSITGQRADGVAFERGGREFIQIQSTALQLGSGHTDHAIPRGGVPGLNSALAVTLRVLSDYADGKLGAFAELVAPDGSVVATTLVSVPASQGGNDVELRFRGEDIYRSKLDGPYTVRNVRLLDERYAPLLSQELASAHTTQAYSYRSFAPQLEIPTVFLEGPFRVTAGEALALTATGIDPEGAVLAYAWDLDDDGAFEISGQFVLFTTSSQDPAGLRTVRVQVVDPAGNAAVAEAQIEIFVPERNRPPVAICRNVTIPADPVCGADGSINAGSYDPDEGDTITCVQTPASPYSLGSQQVTLTCTDTFGFSSSCEAAVTVTEWGPLTLALNGDSEMTLECGGDAWEDPGAKAWGSCGPLEVHRYNSGQDPYGPGPNTDAEGTYSVQYIAWSATGETVSAIRTVRVDDRTAPMLKLKGPQHMMHTCGSGWVDPGVEAMDACYGNIAPEVRWTGYVNGWVEGLYTVRYELTDSGGNSASPVTRTVEVVDCPW